MAANRKRKRRSRRVTKSDSWIGHVLLELVAFAALLFMLAMSNNIDRQTDDQQSSYRLAGVGTAVADFLKDQLEYQRWTTN